MEVAAAVGTAVVGTAAVGAAAAAAAASDQAGKHAGSSIKDDDDGLLSCFMYPRPGDAGFFNEEMRLLFSA